VKFRILTLFFVILIFFISSCATSNPRESVGSITGQVIKEIEQETEKEVKKIEEQVHAELEEFLDEVLTVDERAKEKDKGFTFSSDSIVKTQNGISLSLDDFKYEIKGENWGKITEMTVTILNKGNNNLQPKVLVILYDDKDSTEDKVKTKAEIEFDIFGLGVGEHVTKKIITDISFNDIDLPKTLKVVLVDAYDWDNRAMVVVEKEFIAE